MTGRGFFNRFVLISGCIAVLSLPVRAAHLRGRIVQVGFPGTRLGSGYSGVHYYRSGEWIPVQVELTNDDGDIFTGTIEVRQPDRDGDEVYARREVVVQGTRRFWLYVPGGPGHIAPYWFHVRVYDRAGGPAPMFDDGGQAIDHLEPSMMLDPAQDEARIVLDISSRPLARLDLKSKDVEFVHDWIVVRSAPERIPDQKVGLMMVDTIVWDEVDPSVMDIGQLNALVGWTRLGGRLVLGVQRDWDRVVKSKLGSLLPARLHGTSTMDELPPWMRSFLGIGGFDTDRGGLRPPLVYCPVSRSDLAPGAEVLVPSAEVMDSSKGSGTLLMTRRPFGRGEVVLVAASLRDLLYHGRRNRQMLCELLEARYQPARRNRNTVGGFYPLENDLFEAILAGTGFGVTASLYLLLAFGFVLVYIAVATGGSWLWLKRRGRVRYAWLAFALVALAGSAVSQAGVRWIRGLRYHVHELSFVDGRAGLGEVTVTSFFGLKAPTHERIDVRVPADWQTPDLLEGDAPLLAAIPPVEDFLSFYAASQQYEAVAPIGELRGVPTRATLKQFEARWAGAIQGRVDARLRYLRAGTVELTPDSWVQNNLGVDLADCYLFVTSQNIRPDRPYRDLSIVVYRVGELPHGTRLTWKELAERVSPPVSDGENGRSGDDARSPAFRPISLLELLEACQPGYRPKGLQNAGAAAAVRQMDPTLRKMLFLTFFDEIDVSRWVEQRRTLWPLVCSYGHRLDRSNVLSRSRALLVGFSDRPGPARLCYRPSDRPSASWRLLEPDRAGTVYRIAIPVGES